ncbi:MAG: histidine--tRNA ligase [Weeksellaceae bacterium]|nr:histidine--tRNA ligase [Weeksellaceae bacterium]
MTKPTLPKGTRDFSAAEIEKREYIIKVLRKHFVLYGFAPLETPSFENLSTLTGKYGEEGDRLIFKILNSGEFKKDISAEDLEQKSSAEIAPKISEKALRYDLTVPFARYVVMNRNEISIPFKRFQIQPVWRADRPQKGRYREFYQCDADIVGSQSILQELELIKLYDDCFAELGLAVDIHINHRKILSGLAEVAGIEDKLIAFTVALDKLDKVGSEKVIAEWLEKGIAEDAISVLTPLLDNTDGHEQLKTLKKLLAKSEIGSAGIEELEFILQSMDELGLSQANLIPDFKLARGLEYYTGAILEVKARDQDMGSIGGGGRYDDLTGIFGLKDMPGVGISFGLDRIYLVLETLDLFPKDIEDMPKILFMNFGSAEALQSLKLAAQLRMAGLAAEVYPEEARMKKQFSYADKGKFSHAVMMGAEEMQKGEISVKNMKSGKQDTILQSELQHYLQENSSF